uniref:FIST domain-containing protein n=1 Tax=Magnetococcus massalia (strain MO-1) TaxID=451514 RepID=A0A1S7LMU9_MAGMO|nr:Protein of unknown function [Candidatus Magnetococcus massalia]
MIRIVGSHQPFINSLLTAVEGCIYELKASLEQEPSGLQLFITHAGNDESIYQEALKKLTDYWPNTPIVGCTTSAHYCRNHGLQEHSILLIAILASDTFQISAGSIESSTGWSRNRYALRFKEKAVEQSNVSQIFLFVDALGGSNPSETILAAETVWPRAQVFGNHASSGHDFQRAFVFHDQRVFSNGCSYLLLTGKYAQAISYTAANEDSGWLPVDSNKREEWQCQEIRVSNGARIGRKAVRDWLAIGLDNITPLGFYADSSHDNFHLVDLLQIDKTSSFIQTDKIPAQGWVCKTALDRRQFDAGIQKAILNYLQSFKSAKCDRSKSTSTVFYSCVSRGYARGMLDVPEYEMISSQFSATLHNHDLFGVYGFGEIASFSGSARAHPDLVALSSALVFWTVVERVWETSYKDDNPDEADCAAFKDQLHQLKEENSHLKQDKERLTAELKKLNGALSQLRGGQQKDALIKQSVLNALLLLLLDLERGDLRKLFPQNKHGLPWKALVRELNHLTSQHKLDVLNELLRFPQTDTGLRKLTLPGSELLKKLQTVQDTNGVIRKEDILLLFGGKGINGEGK